MSARLPHSVDRHLEVAADVDTLGTARRLPWRSGKRTDSAHPSARPITILPRCSTAPNRFIANATGSRSTRCTGCSPIVAQDDTMVRAGIVALGEWLDVSVSAW